MMFLVFFLFAQSDPCTVSHAHQYSDLRLAIIEVGKVEKCEFYYSNLEERTTPADPLIFDVEFELSLVQWSEDRTAVKRIEKARLKQGVIGICIYCSYCRACVSMRLIDKSELKRVN
jgi:hypothetical protein